MLLPSAWRQALDEIEDQAVALGDVSAGGGDGDQADGFPGRRRISSSPMPAVGLEGAGDELGRLVSV